MAKRIFVATFGSRGDVEPFLALSKALKSAGYDVLLSAPQTSAVGLLLTASAIIRQASPQETL